MAFLYGLESFAPHLVAYLKAAAYTVKQKQTNLIQIPKNSMKSYIHVLLHKQIQAYICKNTHV